MKNICPFLKEIHNEKNIENILLLLEYEFYLINVLNYDFYVFCPYKAMVGFIHEIKKNQNLLNIVIFSDSMVDIIIHSTSNINPLVNSKDFELKCESLIDQTFFTDLIFLYSYSYISLSCLFITAEFFNIDYDKIKSLLKLDEIIDYENFITTILKSVKENLMTIKIFNEDEFVKNKKKIYKFLKTNPKYVEKIEKDRE
jgi:hypothetical protein